MSLQLQEVKTLCTCWYHIIALPILQQILASLCSCVIYIVCSTLTVLFITSKQYYSFRSFLFRHPYIINNTLLTLQEKLSSQGKLARCWMQGIPRLWMDQRFSTNMWEHQKRTSENCSRMQRQSKKRKEMHLSFMWLSWMRLMPFANREVLLVLELEFMIQWSISCWPKLMELTHWTTYFS